MSSLLNSSPDFGENAILDRFGQIEPKVLMSSYKYYYGGKKFEITERLDQDVNMINPILGHYVWLIKAKRFDFSFEPGINAEPRSDQVYDDTFSGRLPGGSNPATDDKVYDDNAEDSARSVFDYSEYGDNDDVYGDYM